MTEGLGPSPAGAAPGVLEALTRNGLLGSLAAPELSDVAARSALRDLRRGERLFERGDPAVLGVVARGRLKSWIPGTHAREWVRAIVRTGGLCGLAACVDGGRCACNADAMDRTRVVLVPQSALRAAMERDAGFARRVAIALAGEYRTLLAACEDVTLRTPLQRLAHHLASHPATGGVIELRETQAQIAAQLGTVREVVGRGLRELETRGIVSRDGRTVRVLRPKELAAVAL